MRYPSVQKARFLSRPNRFVAYVEWNGNGIAVPCKKYRGAAKSYCCPGLRYTFAKAAIPARKTRFDLIAVGKKRRIVQYRLSSAESGGGRMALGRRPGLFSPLWCWPNRNSALPRLDFYYEATGREGFLEVKGVTLEQSEMLYFPDAPTERGVKHLEELINCKAAGYEAGVLFVIQTARALAFTPNWADPSCLWLCPAKSSMRRVYRCWARCCEVAPDRMKLCQGGPCQCCWNGPENREKRGETLCR